MPTFQSIPIHPLVRSRLDQSQQQGDNDVGSGSHESGQQQQQPARSSVVIPRSLLTRDLSDLVGILSGDDMKNEQQKAGILSQIENIRCEVARRMISRTRNGKRLVSHYQQEECHEQQQKKRRRPLIPAGSISILDARNSKHEMIRKSQNLPQILSTGNSELDNLIAFPTEYFFDPDGDVILPPNADFISGEAKGLPRGYVLKLSGTSGKTQLALQLVSHAMIQSSQEHLGTFQRIRYCYSAAGHSGHSLAQRLFQLIENGMDNSNEESLRAAAKKIEFQPITAMSQLISIIAKLEEEWLQHMKKSPCGEESQPYPNETKTGRNAVSMLVIDALPLMVSEREDPMKIQSLERWLKRLARHYSMTIVIVTSAGSAGSSSIYDNAISSDIHLQIEKTTPTTSSIRLLRHPAKCVTKNDYIAYNPPKFST